MININEVLATVKDKKEEIEVLVTLGAGDIENLSMHITEILKE